MALIIHDARDAEGGTLQYHAYCCMDSMIAREAFDNLYPLLSEEDRIVYDAGMAFMSPALACTLRGTLVDLGERDRAIKRCEKDETEMIAALRLDEEIVEVWDCREPWDNARDGKCTAHPSGTPANHTWSPRGVEPAEQSCKNCGVSRWVVTPINPHSPPQMAHLLYELLGMKPRHSKKAPYGVTTDDDALEALALKYPEHSGLLDKIRDIRGVRKQAGALRSRLDFDGRWRSSFNVAAAESGRMSSSKSPRRTGSNMQNIADKNRGIFVADPGLVLFYADLEQAESRVVANDAECEEDIVDHASGDAHTSLARRIWPSLEGFTWTGDLVRDKQIASQPAPWDPDHDLRHFGKIIRHGTNIGMTKYGIAREAHISLAEAEAMREGYFAAYPRNGARQMEIRREVRETGQLTSPMGRTRVFMGRLWDEATMKEALAQTQQSTIADVLNIAYWRVWYELDNQLNLGRAPSPSDPNRVWLLGQIHDAILGLVRPGDDGTLRRIKAIMETPVRLRGKLVIIPAEIAIGRSWKHSDLKKWKA